MRVVSFLCVVTILLLSCGGENAFDVKRTGERCQDLDLEPSGDDAVRVEGTVVRLPEDYTPVTCIDEGESDWIVLGYRSNSDLNEHSFAATFGIWTPGPVVFDRVTSDLRFQALWEWARACVEKTNSTPRCQDPTAQELNLTISGLDCVSWEETWVDVQVAGAEGEKWPVFQQAIACFDPASPPTRLAMLTWSERHAPGVEPLSNAERTEHIGGFLESLAFGTP